VFVQCVLIASLINALPPLSLTLRYLGGSVSALLQAIAAPALAATGMALMLFTLAPWFSARLPSPGWGLLLLKIALAALTYSLLMLLFGRRHLEQLLGRPLRLPGRVPSFPSKGQHDDDV